MDELRLHAMGLSAGLSTTVPDPVGNDGTSEGMSEGSCVAQIVPTLEDILSSVVRWWTCPWPELHTKFEQSSADGPSIFYQEKCDLIGRTKVEEASLHVSTIDDPIEEQSFYEALAANIIDVWAFTLATKIAALLCGVAASIACTFCIAPVNPWHLFLAAVLVSTYTGLVLEDLILSIEKAISMTDNALMRWWIIVGSELLLILGWICYGIVIPYANFYKTAKMAATASDFSSWMCSLTDASVIFLLWKVCLIAFIFYIATVVFTWTLAGWI